MVEGSGLIPQDGHLKPGTCPGTYSANYSARGAFSDESGQDDALGETRRRSVQSESDWLEPQGRGILICSAAKIGGPR
jgi:hypothetical protein